MCEMICAPCFAVRLLKGGNFKTNSSEAEPNTSFRVGLVPGIFVLALIARLSPTRMKTASAKNNGRLPRFRLRD